MEPTEKSALVLYWSSVAGIPYVAVIVKNSHDQVLLLLRDNKPGLSFANHWTLPGGCVEFNETIEAAVQRELQEEIGLELSVTVWKTYERIAGDVLVEQHVFVSSTDCDISAMTLGEGQALRFFDKDQLALLPIGFEFEHLLTEYFREKPI
jgi:8-oxo-dGTP diphosphatase